MRNPSALISARAGRRLLSLPLAIGLIAAMSGSASGSARASGSVRAGSGTTPSVAGTWKLLPAAPATSKPFQISSVWTGRQMIIHGVFSGTTAPGRFTLAYRPATGSWGRLAQGPAWSAVESDDVATWAGSRMLIFGLTNGAFDPAANRWTAVPGPTGGPSSEVLGWTGHQLIMWLGSCCGGGSDGAQAYNTATRTWHKLPAAPLETRAVASGTWTGKELIVAGGVTTEPSGPERTLRDGAAYNPATGTWRKIAPMPAGRWGAKAVWDGKEVLFIGGSIHAAGNGVRLATRGLAYNPASNRWRWLPTMQYPRSEFAAVWTGHQILIWGGLTAASIAPPHGEAYTPATGKWTAMPASPLRGRAEPVAVWTGRQMIIWGGWSSGGTFMANGAAFTPAR